ncbi:acyltransferase [Nocardia sp. NPDC051052]|uniref:acyltransferase n=1 Tax=Nocardia sp. NPDC051052 TaxID=3364322 RepID=UPI003793D605
MGDGAQIAARASILGSRERPVRIGDGAWIGVGAFIGSGVKVGAHAIVGAGSQVYEDIPELAISYGRPAVIRGEAMTRFDEGDGIASVLSMVRKRGSRNTTSLFDGAPVDRDAFLDCAATLGADVSIGRGAIMIGRPDGPSPDGGITVGDRARLGDYLIAEGGGGLTIEPDVVVGRAVTITTSTHDHRRPGRPWTPAPVHIDAGAVIGDDATIAGPIRVGASATVGCGAVVTGSVAAGSISKGIFR